MAVTHDTPDLSFTMESYDMTTAVEQLVTKSIGDPGPFHLAAPMPIDIASQWKRGKDDPAPFEVVESVAIPQLALESVSYRFGVRDNATQTFTLRGDSIFFNPGPTIVEAFVGSGVAAQELVLTHPAGVYNGDTIAGPRRALNVMAGARRLLYGVDYTEATVGVGAFRDTTITLLRTIAAGVAIQVVYFTNDVVEYLQSVHPSTTVKPAAIRGRDITVLLNGVALTNRLTGIQSVQVDQRFTIERDEEVGSAVATSIDYADVPAVTGNLTVRFQDPADLHARLVEGLGIASDEEAIGAQQFSENRLDMVFHHPDTGAVLKTVEVPDAVITLPGFSARVNTKLDVQLNWESDSGTLDVLAGAPA